MTTALPRLLLLGLALAGPAAAQDADPAGQLIEGFVACHTGAGDAELVQAALEAQGWTTAPGEDGLTNFQPGTGDDTFAYMADDGSFCHVESMVIDSATASEVLAATLEAAGESGIDYEKDGMGCTVLRLSDGSSATITSGGNDPVCGSDSDSAVRFATE